MEGLTPGQELALFDVSPAFLALLGKSQGHLERLKVVLKLMVYASA